MSIVGLPPLSAKEFLLMTARCVVAKAVYKKEIRKSHSLYLQKALETRPVLSFETRTFCLR